MPPSPSAGRRARANPPAKFTSFDPHSSESSILNSPPSPISNAALHCWYGASKLVFINCKGYLLGSSSQMEELLKT